MKNIEKIYILFVELVIQGLSKTDAEDLKVGMRLKHGTTEAIDFAHCFEKHRGLSGALLTDDEIVMTAASPGNNVINPRLLVSRNPMLLMGILVFAGHHTRDFKSGITWFERIVHLIQDQVLVVLVVRVARHSVE